MLCHLTYVGSSAELCLLSNSLSVSRGMSLGDLPLSPAYRIEKVCSLQIKTSEFERQSDVKPGMEPGTSSPGSNLLSTEPSPFCAGLGNQFVKLFCPF